MFVVRVSVTADVKIVVEINNTMLRTGLFQKGMAAAAIVVYRRSMTATEGMTESEITIVRDLLTC